MSKIAEYWSCYIKENCSDLEMAEMLVQMSNTIELFKDEWFKHDAKKSANNLILIDTKFRDVIYHFCELFPKRDSSGEEKSIVQETAFGFKCKFVYSPVSKRSLEEIVITKIHVCYMFSKLDSKVLKKIFRIPKNADEKYERERSQFISNFLKIQKRVDTWDFCTTKFLELCHLFQSIHGSDYEKLCGVSKESTRKQKKIKMENANNE
jgi:hypothetical protein